MSHVNFLGKRGAYPQTENPAIFNQQLRHLERLLSSAICRRCEQDIAILMKEIRRFQKFVNKTHDHQHSYSL